MQAEQIHSHTCAFVRLAFLSEYPAKQPNKSAKCRERSRKTSLQMTLMKMNIMHFSANQNLYEF
jgi:hypothetical protein